MTTISHTLTLILSAFMPSLSHQFTSDTIQYYTFLYCKCLSSLSFTCCMKDMNIFQTLMHHLHTFLHGTPILQDSGSVVGGSGSGSEVSSGLSSEDEDSRVSSRPYVLYLYILKIDLNFFFQRHNLCALDGSVHSCQSIISSHDWYHGSFNIVLSHCSL